MLGIIIIKMIKIYLFAIALITLNACTQSHSTEKNYETFLVTKAIETDTATYTEYVANIQALQNVEVRARLKGYLEKIYVDEGQSVTKGQLLFTINSREYTDELAMAKGLNKSAIAEVNEATLELKTLSKLAEKKIISQTEVELAKNKLDAKKAKKEETEAHVSYSNLKLSNTQIRAPFTGTINRIPNKVGSLIDDGTLLTSISENQEVFAYFDVSEKEYLSYIKHLKYDSVNSKTVDLILADGTTHTQKGKIETIEGVIDANTGNIAFRARFKNPDNILKHGASGKVKLCKKLNKVVIIPQKATFEIQDKLYVYVVDKNSTVVMRNIESQHRLANLFLVNKGLQAGETIIFEGVQNAKAGMVIKAKQIEMPNIIKQLASN
ncbi:MAG: efflux RND transporter periplasmic adaptor subunit [Sphingobacteriales bacterium]|nr:MAG: efflux RND transporter periplasmic adaptor subunit [Sphingobacteriales bacterium]TAF82812.1 MAG: efflux RND transporter periplasmic adaptor subunit [Sphingobacteriales bacterium]